jgi:hypothetical protein
MEVSYRRHRFPPVVIQHAVRLYPRFTLSYRDVEDLLAERRQPWRQRMQAPRQSDVQAVGQEGDEDVRLGARLELVKDRPDCEVAFEILERLLDRHQQQIMAPQLGGVFLDEIGAQQIPAFAQSCLPQLVAIEPIAESGALCRNLERDQAPAMGRNLASELAPRRIRVNQDARSNKDAAVVAVCADRGRDERVGAADRRRCATRADG